MGLVFNSNLSQQEIDNNFRNVDFFSGLMEGLTEALAYEQGSAKAATVARKRELPNINVAELRKNNHLSQKAFAEVIGVSPRTVEAWESGRSNPSPTARNLLYLISLDCTLIGKLHK